MEPTQSTPTNTWIPQGIPTGVFVPNNQPPVTSPETPVQNISQPSVSEQASVAAPVQQASSPSASQWMLDKMIMWLVRFIAKITGNPDPITWEVSPAAQSAFQKTENIVGKVWNVANKAVSTASDVASKATTVVTQATEKIQQVVPPPAAQPTTPISSEPAPVPPPVPEQPTATPAP